MSYAQYLPTPAHVVVVIEENYAYSQIIGSSYAPYMNSLCSSPYCAVFTQSYAIEHPSEPNYLDLYSGQNQGITDDNYPTADGVSLPFTDCNMGYQLISSGKSFISYSESMPSVGYDGVDYAGSTGEYYRKHNPCTNWCNSLGAGANTYSDTINQPFAGYFPDSANYTTLPTVSYVIPNGTNDMHDGSYPTNITTGDTWMQTYMRSLINWAIATNTLVIWTFDEDDDLHGNNIPTLFIGSMVQGGTYSKHITHYNVLRTIEQMYSLGYCGNAADSSAIYGIWRAPAGLVNFAAESATINVVPNPANTVALFNSDKAIKGMINLMDINGNLVGQYPINGTSAEVNTAAFAQGLYVYKILNDANNKVVNEGKFVITHN